MSSSLGLVLLRTVHSYSKSPMPCRKLEHMLSEIDEIGHMVEGRSYLTPTPGLTATGGVVYDVIAESGRRISRADIETYPERRRKRWAIWL